MMTMVLPWAASWSKIARISWVDSESTFEILAIFDQLAAQGRTIVIITHEETVAQRAHRVVTVKDGLITADHLNRERELAR